MGRFVDLSHVVRDGMTTYPGLPAPSIRDHLGREASEPHYAPGTTFQIGSIEMVANTGTYVDAPFHRYADGVDLARLPLASLADLPGRVVCARAALAVGERALGPELFDDVPLAGRAVLVDTGWCAHFGTPEYALEHPFLTRAAAERLAAEGAAFVGIDSLNIDDAADGTRPAHTVLLGAGIPIGEHLCSLNELPEEGFRFFAVPVRVAGMGSFPVRAFAILNPR